MPNVNHPVKAKDPTTNTYGKLKTTHPAMEHALNKAFENTHGNLFNEDKNKNDTPGLQAMKRRQSK